MKSASAARLTRPRRATSRKPSTWTSWMPLGFPLRDSSIATAGATNSIYGELAAVALEKHTSGCDRDRPHRRHCDQEGADGIAGGVRVAVERFEHQDRADHQQHEGHGDAHDSLDSHQAEW